MAPKLTGFAGNSRVRRVLAAAALAGVELDYDKSFSMRSDWKNEAFLAKFPLGYLPALEDGGLHLQEVAAISEYVATIGPNSTLLPSNPKDLALVHQWQSYADQEIYQRHGFASRILGNAIPYTKPAFTAAYEMLLERLMLAEKYFLHKTYAVGERITLADLALQSVFNNAFSGLVDASAREKFPNLVRFTETLNNHPQLASIFDNGKPTWTQTQEVYQAPKKEEKPKAAVAATPAAPKAEKKPKEKKPKDDDDDDEEPLVPEEPKQKNPLDDLPKSAFNLEEWKRQYSNLDTRKEALPWFYEKFDHDGFSIWRVDFKYNEELTQVFMSSNQIGGFFNRLEASRKYLFGSMGVLGKANDSIITGAVILRGKDFKPVMDVAPDWESYSYQAIDLSKPDDKEFFEGAMAWDLVAEGRSWADGKNFK